MPTHPVTHSVTPSQALAGPHTLVPMPALFPQPSGPGGNKLSPLAASCGSESRKEGAFLWSNLGIFLMCMYTVCMYMYVPCMCHPPELEVQGL